MLNITNTEGKYADKAKYLTICGYRSVREMLPFPRRVDKNMNRVHNRRNLNSKKTCEKLLNLVIKELHLKNKLPFLPRFFFIVS